MKIEELFKQAEHGALTYDQFAKLVKDAKANFADLSEGGYVSKHKYEDELAAKVKEIELLNSTVLNRDNDLADLRKQLDDLDDGVIQIKELNSALKELQGKYDDDTKKYKEQLKAQAYEFAVKEFANEQNFTSQAAKRDFIHLMMDAKLQMKDGELIGASDFKKQYSKENADAFAKEAVQETPSASNESKPQFVGSTPGASAAKTPSLTQMMMAANENPGMNITF